MKKAYGIIQKIVVVIIAIVMILMIFSMIIGNSKYNVFGYNGFIVLSDSMKATDFDAGDLIIVKEVDVSTLKEGDIISYISQDSDNYMDIVTHKIRRVAVNSYGQAGFITYGTTTGVDDEVVVTYPYIIGKYQFKIPKIGIFLRFVKTVPGYFIFVVIPFFILIFMQFISTVDSFRDYKNIRINNLRTERKKLKNERKNIEKMLEELRILKDKEEIKSSSIDEKNEKAKNVNLEESSDTKDNIVETAELDKKANVNKKSNTNTKNTTNKKNNSNKKNNTKSKNNSNKQNNMNKKTNTNRKNSTNIKTNIGRKNSPTRQNNVNKKSSVNNKTNITKKTKKI